MEKMMPTQPALSTSTTITADSPKGQKFIELCRAQYNKAGLIEDSAQLLNESKAFVTYLAEGIRKFSAKGPVFPVYLEVEAGGKSKDNLLKELKADGCEISSWAQAIMGKPEWNPGEKQTVKFARATVRELGFTTSPTTREIWARIEELGHNLCEPQDGPAIRLALKKQPRGDYFWVAMKQITGSGGSPRVFFLKRHVGGKRWLDANWVSPVNEWNLDNGVVFRLRK